jgi:hypothetical protein
MNDAAARALTLDEFAALMLAEGRYDVDPLTGRVWNPRTQRTLSPIVKRFGYEMVNLVFSRAVVRQVKIHRLVAIKVHGVPAAAGKQVAHLDGVTNHNSIDNLWLAPSARDHVKYDGTDRNLTFRAAQKTSWPPCARCGDPDGRSSAGTTPDRITGDRFGIDGPICRRCYGALQERERRRRHSMASGATA